MKPKLILCLALVLSGVLVGCSSISRKNPCETVTTAINREDWVTLRRLAKPGMVANDYIPKWEKHPVRVGKLIRIEKDSQYHLDGKPCTIYSFEWESKDGTPNPHWLQILVREEGRKPALLDFWNFGW